MATCPACVAIRLMTSGSRRVCVMASSCFCVRVRMLTSPFSGIREHQALVGHDDAGEHALQMAGGVGEQALQVVGAARLRMTAGHRQQQLEILVARVQRLVEHVDVGARQQVAAQQLERGLQVIVHVGERQHVGIDLEAVADHGDDRGDIAALRRAARIDRRARRRAARSAGRRRRLLPGGSSRCAMACSTSANRSGFVLAALLHSSLPVLSNRLTEAARGSSERTSCAYGSMEFSKDISAGPSPNGSRRALMQLAFLPVGPKERRS